MRICQKLKTALLFWICISMFLLVDLTTLPLYALRANLTKDLKRLEEMGHYEQVLFYRKSTMDMVRALHAQWSGVPYDPSMDGVYNQLDRIYGTGNRTQDQQVEIRVDRRYWNIINGQKRVISGLLEKAELTSEQLELLNERVRIYVENHLSPEFDEMGNFFFRRKAMIFEQTGLFWDASFRRYLTGHYDMRVCVPYYDAVSEELEYSGQRSMADAYRRKSEWYREQALREFRRSDGDRILSELQESNRRKFHTREQIIELLKAGIQLGNSDARFAAILILAELGEMDVLLPAAGDPDVELRREVVRIFAENTYSPGLTVLLEDKDEQIRETAKSVLKSVPNELSPGILTKYYNRPGQPPVVTAILRSVDLGFRGNERFPDLLRPYWGNEDIIPADARGQFLLEFRGIIYLPGDGQYRFYVKTEGDNRAIVRLIDSSGKSVDIISPKNDRKLLYADQCNWDGGSMSRIDFSAPLHLEKGPVRLEIDYKGDRVRNSQGTAGIRLYWSSDDQVMEPVPASAIFHESR